MKFIPNVTAKQIFVTVAVALAVVFYGPELIKFLLACGSKTLALFPKW